MKKIVALLIAAGVSLSAFAAPENFSSDANHTFSSFSYSHFGFSNQTSRFNNTTAKVTLDRAAKTGSVEATIDTKSVDTGSKLFDGHIQGEDFLDTAKFPTITYKSTKVNFKGDVPSTVEGNLTIKGVTKPVTLTVTHFKCMDHPMMKKLACGANATATIKRTEFNAGKYAPNVGDDVTLTFAIEALKD
nr:YceI family protein [uncultured Duganella sp.]